ncbi:MAG: hypothetical protein ABII08_02855, partial [Candidatus Beckwithbacteria bacterium]
VYHNVTPYFRKNVYKIEENYDVADLPKALLRASEWDYSFQKDSKVATGVFYKKARPTFEEQYQHSKKAWYLIDRKPNWEDIIKEFKS